MQVKRVAINGMGRIGRTLVREYIRRKAEGETLGFEIVAYNNPGPGDIYAHLLKNDSVHGTLPYPVEIIENGLIVNGHKIVKYSEREPARIPWEMSEIDIVIEATGKFRDRASMGEHLKGTVKKVVLCAPGKDIDGTFVMGINHESYDPAKHHLISNASCTTNCLAPIAKILNDNFKITQGMMTTVHAYTSDQNLLDNSHKDLRRARAAALSMIPTSTGAAKALGLVLPELKGKLDGYAVRVPTPNVSMVDLSVCFEKSPSVSEINGAIREAANSSMKGIIAYIEDELVSTDFVTRPESSMFDAPLTTQIQDMTKIVSWYDNEAGFSNRVLELTDFISKQ